MPPAECVASPTTRPMPLLELPDEVKLFIAKSFLNAHYYKCLPRLSSTCHALRILLRNYAGQAKRRRMRWMPSSDSTLSADGTVVVLNEQGTAPGALFITALASLVPTAGCSTWTVHIEEHARPAHPRSSELLLCLCDADGNDVGRTPASQAHTPLRRGTAVTFTYDATNGTLGISTVTPIFL